MRARRCHIERRGKTLVVHNFYRRYKIDLTSVKLFEHAYFFGRGQFWCAGLASAGGRHPLHATTAKAGPRVPLEDMRLLSRTLNVDVGPPRM
jgi:hypothetical protein